MERDQTLQLPDEILDQIIRDAGPRYGTAASHTTFPGKENWLSCASVCRRWHKITLPLSFRYIRVSPSGYMDTDTDCAAVRFDVFLHGNPSIAPLIQEVNFIRCMIATPTLISILEALRHLQYLILHRSLVRGNLDSRQPPMGHKLCKLLVTGGACDVYNCAEEVCGGQIPRLLCLFSEIEEFEDLRGCGHEDRFVQDLEGEAARTLSLSAKFEPLYLDTMRRLGLFNHITCLQLKVSFNVTESGAEGCDVFRVMGPTLKELYLTLIMHLSDRSTPQRDIVETFCSGLVLCSSLHGFRLHLEDTKIHGNIAAGSARKTLPTPFSVGIDIVALLSPTKLRYLSFAYPTYMHPRASPQDIRALDLARLRDICRRYVNLESLNLVAYDAYDKVDVKTAFKTFANEELSEFKSILRHDEPGEFFRCSEPTCAWFSGGKLNTIIAFHRDVLKSYWTPR